MTVSDDLTAAGSRTIAQHLRPLCPPPSSPGTPRYVERPQLPQVLSDELDAVIRHLGAPGQRQHGQVGQGVHDVDDAVVGDLPAGLQPEHVESARLLGAEVAEGGVRHVVGLQVELVERREELGDGADALVRHVDAVVDGDGDEARVEGGPQALLGDFVAPCRRRKRKKEA